MKTYKSLGGSNRFPCVLIKRVLGDMESAEDMFFAVFVAGLMPPNQKAQLEHGFKTLRELKAYCAHNGIALWRIPSRSI